LVVLAPEWANFTRSSAGSRLIRLRGPPQVGFEISSFLKVQDVANGRNEGGTLDHPDPHRQKNLPFAAVSHHAANFSLKLVHMLLEELEFFDELALLQHQSLQSDDIGSPNTLSRQLLKLDQLIEPGATFRSQGNQRG